MPRHCPPLACPIPSGSGGVFSEQWGHGAAEWMWEDFRASVSYSPPPPSGTREPSLRPHQAPGGPPRTPARHPGAFPPPPSGTREP